MRSIFLWRMLLMLSITVLLAALFMMGGYMYLSRDTYTAIKLSELLPKAKIVCQVVQEYQLQEISSQAFHNIVGRMMEEDDTICVITDANGEIGYLNEEAFGPDIDVAQAKGLLKEEMQTVLSGQNLQKDNIRLSNGEFVIAAGVPIKAQDNATVGAVLLLKSVEEINAATGELNAALLLAAVIVFPLTMVISSFAFRRITGPLHRMGEVAIQMSKGDFQVRANEDEVGEVGLLARALNTLCDNLSHTIHQLRAEKSQLNQILASFTEGVAATDSLGMLTHYNPALMEMFGAVCINSRMDLVPDAAVWQAFDAVFQSGEPQSMHYPLPGERMLWITISPVVTEAGDRAGVVGLFKDMTEMERLERTRREYVANVSHELRTPLTAVRGLLEPLADGMVKSEEDRQRYYRIMLREVLRLSRLITDMMELSRLQSGTGYMELSQVEINEVLQDVLQGYEKEAKQRGISLQLETVELPTVLTDPDRVEQVLVILLDNAMRYTPRDGKITLKAEDGARLKISVQDTGCGIPKEDQEHVFDRFYKVDKSRKEGGTGLGLSIAKFIMDKLGETIWLESEPGKGACFSFTLKKYVKNAIPLGPVQEAWKEQETIALSSDEVEQALPKTDAFGSQDAPYEVLPEEKKKAKVQEQPLPRKPRMVNTKKNTKN